ncbi:DUF3078 domain-containing protein, partial [candidate division KSB1 bacterium]
MDANLTITQNTYSDNWTGGESGALSWTFNSNSLAEKQLSEKVFNKNTMKLFFGQTHNQLKETKIWAKPVKNTDLIDLESVFRFSIGGYVEPFAAARLESQFLDGGDPINERYVNPLKLTESFGITRVFIKEEKREWIIRLGGGLRQHINRSVLDPLTGTKETVKSYDSGIVLDNEFKTTFSEGLISYSSKFTLFQALQNSKADDLKGMPNEKYWKSPDINWENIFTANIAKYLMVNLYVQF